MNATASRNAEECDKIMSLLSSSLFMDLFFILWLLSLNKLRITHALIRFWGQRSSKAFGEADLTGNSLQVKMHLTFIFFFFLSPWSDEFSMQIAFVWLNLPLSFSESLGEWIVVDLELSHARVLITSNSDKLSLRKVEYPSVTLMHSQFSDNQS